MLLQQHICHWLLSLPINKRNSANEEALSAPLIFHLPSSTLLECKILSPPLSHSYICSWAPYSETPTENLVTKKLKIWFQPGLVAQHHFTAETTTKTI